MIPLSTGLTSIGIVFSEEFHNFVELSTPGRLLGWLSRHEPWLHAWLSEREIGGLKVSCLGCDNRTEFAGFESGRLPCRETPGWAAISVARVLIPSVGSPVDCHDWLGAHEPVARIGHSILVYRIPAR